MNKQHENNEKNSTLKSIWEIIVGLSSIAALILSYIALSITHQGGDINISTHSRVNDNDSGIEYEETFINNEINIDLIQLKEELNNVDLSDYDSFGNRKRLEYPETSRALIDTSYLYIDNKGKFSESDVIIQFESNDIYFEGEYIDNLDTDTTQNKGTIAKQTNYEFELFNYIDKYGHTTFRIKLNPGGYLYSGLTEKIMLDNIFNGKVNWFYDGEFKNGKATVPVKVTIASQKYKSKTFTINLNITKDYYLTKKAEGKHYYENLTACSTKILRMLYTMCKNNTTFKIN